MPPYTSYDPYNRYRYGGYFSNPTPSTSERRIADLGLRLTAALARLEAVETLAKDTASDLDTAYDALMNTGGVTPTINVHSGGTVSITRTVTS